MASVPILQGWVATPEVLVQARSLGQQAVLDYERRPMLDLPLGGSRAALPRVCLNLMIVFLVSGLWHGAARNFVVWGALHGFYLVAGKLSEPWRAAFRRRLGLERFPRLLWIWQVGCVFTLVTYLPTCSTPVDST